jgi:DNA-directed RNA polymerase specialized sigma24 family protein
MFNLREDVIGAFSMGFSADEIAESQDVDKQTVKEIISEHKRKMRDWGQR